MDAMVPAVGLSVFRLSPVILAAAGIQNPDYVPRLLCQLRRAGWTGRRPTWNIPADTHQVGWGKGLWIPAAARMTGVGVKMGSRFLLRQERRGIRLSSKTLAVGLPRPERHGPGLLQHFDVPQTRFQANIPSCTAFSVGACLGFPRHGEIRSGPPWRRGSGSRRRFKDSLYGGAVGYRGSGRSQSAGCHACVGGLWADKRAHCLDGRRPRLSLNRRRRPRRGQYGNQRPPSHRCHRHLMLSRCRRFADTQRGRPRDGRSLHHVPFAYFRPQRRRGVQLPSRLLPDCPQ